MAAKFKVTLGALPDFILPVSFVMPNGDEAEIKFKVRHKKASEIKALYDGEAKDYTFINEVCTGWDLEDEFNSENAQAIVDFFPSIALALAQAYMGALVGQRVKN